MPIKNINTIVEGCMPDTPERLMYCGVQEQIPENASVLRIKERTKYLLYYKTNFNRDCAIVNNPFFDSYEDRKKIEGGFPLENLNKNVDWIFDAQRSFTTRDGRIYVESIFFLKDWRWYLEAVPTILKECKEMFRGEKSEGYFYKNPSRAW